MVTIEEHEVSSNKLPYFGRSKHKTLSITFEVFQNAPLKVNSNTSFYLFYFCKPSKKKNKEFSTKFYYLFQVLETLGVHTDDQMSLDIFCIIAAFAEKINSMWWVSRRIKNA